MLLNKYEKKKSQKIIKTRKSKSLMIIRRKKKMSRSKKHMPFQTPVFPFSLESRIWRKLLMSIHLEQQEDQEEQQEQEKKERGFHLENH